MKINSNTQLPKGSEGSVSLTKALAQNEHAKTLVADAAKELSSVNEVLKQELAEKHPPPAVENAIEKSEGVEGKVQEVADKLAIVNLALQGEVRDRVMLDHQLAAVTEQGEAARYAAFHDPLTGLPNRALFSDRLEHALAQALRHGWHLALMFVDLNKFKKINDIHGHDAGDRVLQTIAERLKQNTRADDTISRHGGDEFLYLLMETPDEKVVSAIAEKILQAIQVPCQVSVGDESLSLCVSASIGISLFPKNGTTAEALINSADAAMYVAKHSKAQYGFAK